MYPDQVARKPHKNIFNITTGETNERKMATRSLPMKQQRGTTSAAANLASTMQNEGATSDTRH